MKEYSDQLWEEVNAYVNNQLTDAERKNFESRLNGEEGLDDLLAFYRQAEKAAFLQGKELLRGKVQLALKEAREEEQSEATPVVSMRRKVNWIPYAVAASVLVLVGLFFILSRPKTASTTELYAQYMEPAVISSFRNSSETADRKWQQAIQVYQQEKYDEVIQTVPELLEDSAFTNAKISEARLMIGASYMELDQPDQALEYLNSIVEGSIAYPQAQWYKALAYLKSDNVEATRSQLSAIIEGPYPGRRDDAVALLQQLQEIE